MANLSKSKIYKSFVKQIKNYKKNFKYTNYFTAIVAVLTFLDLCVLTPRAISLGAHEQNAIPLYFINHFGLWSLSILALTNTIVTYAVLFIFNFVLNHIKKYKSLLILIGIYAVLNYLPIVIYMTAVVFRYENIIMFFLKHKWLI